MGSDIGASIRRTMRLVTVIAVLLAAEGLSNAFAQSLFGVLDPTSPFVFSPGLRGEVQATPIWVKITGGHETLRAVPAQDWGLRETFGMTRTNLFIDTMIKFSVGRFSVRGHYEPREFVGRRTTDLQGTTPRHEAEARLDYSGIRIGGDIDFFLPYGIYVGGNLDYDLYQPIFTESITTANPGRPPGKKILGESPLTLGFHVVVNPLTSYYGISPIFDVRVRWPISGAQLTDLELAAGARTSETILGSVALRFGWRRTELAFSASQLYFNQSYSTKFDAVWEGWFGQFCYYY